MSLKILLFLFAFALLCQAKQGEEWKDKVIYQLLTDRFSTGPDDPPTPCPDLRKYCGGTYRGAISKLDYLQNLGVDAIWISPMLENKGDDYHGYAAMNLYKLNPHFGTKQDLLDLIAECHARDMWVILDVVPNHMGIQSSCYNDDNCPDPNDFSEFVPFNESKYYHDLCVINDYENQEEVENCRIFYLVDLDQDNPEVTQILYDWIRDTTAEYGFDGYRIDTARHVKKDFFPGYQQAAGTFVLGEVAGDENHVEYDAEYQSYMDGILNFPMFWSLRRVFSEGYSMTYLKDNIQRQRSAFINLFLTGLFVDNHDYERFLYFTPDWQKLESALAFIFFFDGIPIIYAGTELGFDGGADPDNRESMWPYFSENHELFRFIKTTLEARKQLFPSLVDKPAVDLFVDDQTYVYSRGFDHEVLVAVSNRPMTDGPYSIFVNSIFVPDGTNYVNLYDASDVIFVTGSSVTMEFDFQISPKVYIKQ